MVKFLNNYQERESFVAGQKEPQYQFVDYTSEPVFRVASCIGSLTEAQEWDSVFQKYKKEILNRAAQRPSEKLQHLSCFYPTFRDDFTHHLFLFREMRLVSPFQAGYEIRETDTCVIVSPGGNYRYNFPVVGLFYGYSSC